MTHNTDVRERVAIAALFFTMSSALAILNARRSRPFCIFWIAGVDSFRNWTCYVSLVMNSPQEGVQGDAAIVVFTSTSIRFS